jgi:3-deoxy-D-manno-octulosonate 8-phosphate phosphatase (KDO 8-P phosphatase)
MKKDTLNRIKKIKIVVMDVDGVMTDGKIILGSCNAELKLFDARDGVGIKYLQRVGIKVAIITGRESEAVEMRAKELDIELVYQNAKKKIDAYNDLKEKMGYKDTEIAYIGDDLPDIPIMRRVGFAIAVANATDVTKEFAHYVTENNGGYGAIREVAELIMKAQNKWKKIMERYLED